MVPRLAESEKTMAALKTFLYSSVPFRVNVGKITWDWFPAPHVSVKDVEVSDHDFHLVVPEADIYPDWFMLVRGEPRFDRVVINDPDFELSGYESSNGTLPCLDKLPGTVAVHGGAVRVGSGIFMPGLLFGNRETVFSGLEGDLNISRRNGSMKIVCSCTPSYAHGLHVEATLKAGLESYTAWARMDELDINRLFEFYSGGRSDVPDIKDINLFLSVSGDRPGYVTGTLELDAPCITIADTEKDIDISCGVLSSDINLSPLGFKAHIKQFDLEYPHLHMTGNIDMNRSTESSGDAEWNIDLRAREVDLAGVRRVVLNLFGSSREVQDVCDIVRGGMAPELTYRFSGKTSDFEFIDHMILTAMVDRAPIYIPDPDLFLQEASGPIRIEGGVLYGTDLTGRLGNASAENGRLVLGLSEDLFNFNLDLDIKADLTELQPVLERLIHDNDVVGEIKKFHNVRGTAWGNLKIGNDLRDFDVWVALDRVEGRAFYDRLGWPLEVTGAKAHITPRSVTWSDVSGVAGTSNFAGFAGMVDWKHETELDIADINADVNASELLNYLNTYDAISDDISMVVSALDGKLAVKHAMLQGPAFTPEDWRYSLDACPVSLAIDSPCLPSGVQALSGNVVLTEDTLKLSKLKIRVHDEPIAMDADMSHHFLRNWQGRFIFSGTYGPYVGEWIRENGWIGSDYSLSVPSYVPELKLVLDPDAVMLKGRLVFDRGTSREMSIYIAEHQGRSGFFLKKLRIEAPGDTARLTLLMPASGASLDLSWQGRLSGSTADRIFERNRLVKGGIAGDFSMSLRQESGAVTGSDHGNVQTVAAPNPVLSNARGDLRLSGVVWPWGVKEPVIVRHLSLKGRGTSATLHDAVLNIAGDTLDIAGELFFVPGGIRYDLGLHSPVLHKESMDKVWTVEEKILHAAGENVTVTGSGMHEVPGPEDVGAESLHAYSGNVTEDDNPDSAGLLNDFKIYGNIDFDLNKFVDSGMFNIDVDSDNATGMDREMAILDLEGSMKVFPDSRIETHVISGDFCGMQLSGNETLCRDGDIIRSYTLRTPEHADNRFENIDECLGVNSNLLEGPAKVDAYFYMQDGSIKRGHVDIAAHDGKLRQFTLLSRIFSVVNLVDFLDKKGWQEMTSGGLAYSGLNFRSNIEDDILKIDQAAIMGNGLNLFGTGSIDFGSRLMDVVVIVAPLKTVDAIVTNIPILGKGLGGEHDSFITIPVGVKGPVDNPEVKALPVKTVTDMLKKILTSPFQFPMGLFRQAPQVKKRQVGVSTSTMHARQCNVTDDRQGKKKMHAPEFDPDE